MSNHPSISQASSASSASRRITQGSNRLYDILSLEDDGSNFQNWKFRVTKVLKIRRLWKVVDGTEKKPDGTDQALLDEWLEKDEEAHAQITLTLKDEPLNGVLHTSSAEEAWKRLSERYEGKGKQSIAYLIGELFRGTLSEESPMETQLNSMRQKAAVLNTLGQSLEGSLIAIAMVISLPQSYSTLQTILMSTSDKLTIETVISQVLVEEKSRRTTESQSASALVARTSNKQKNEKEEKNEGRKWRRGKCNYCDLPGHWESECQKKMADEKVKGRDSRDKDKDVEEKDEKTEVSARVARMVREDAPLQLFIAREPKLKVERSPGEWIIDSGASANMSCQREWFKTGTLRTLTPGRPVEIGDGRCILATGIGNIEMDVEVGLGKTRRTLLQDVYLVPELDGNLLSIPHLMRKGFEAKFDERTCAITRDGSVAALARRQESLYVLRGHTCSGGRCAGQDTVGVDRVDPLYATGIPLQARKARMDAPFSGRTMAVEAQHVALNAEDLLLRGLGTSKGEKKALMKGRTYQVKTDVAGINVDPAIGGEAAGGRDADLAWPRWKKGVNEEPNPMKVKSGSLTFGTIQSGATGRWWQWRCTAVEEGSISGSSGGAIKDGGRAQNLPGFSGRITPMATDAGRRAHNGLLSPPVGERPNWRMEWVQADTQVADMMDHSCRKKNRHFLLEK